jgi:hypothetical protein
VQNRALHLTDSRRVHGKGWEVQGSFHWLDDADQREMRGRIFVGS